MEIKRRSFLKTLAAAGLAGGSAGRAFARRVGQWKPPPRWEWEVGEWRDGRREWGACITMLPWEISELIAGTLAVNASEFCAVGKHRLQLSNLRIERIAHHLLRVDVALMESTYRRDGWYVADGSVVRWAQVYKRTNFYDLFRGEHAVLSIGQKEVDGCCLCCVEHEGSAATCGYDPCALGEDFTITITT